MSVDEKYVVFQYTNGKRNYLEKKFYDTLKNEGRSKDNIKILAEDVSLIDAEDILNGIKKIV